MKNILYPIGFFALIILGLIFNLISCGDDPAKETHTERVIEVPGEQPAPTPQPIEMAGLYVSDSNASEVEVYTEANRSYVKKIYIEFTNTYGGIDYIANINLTSPYYSDIIDSVVEVIGPVFKVSQMSTTTVAPAELMFYTSNYSTSASNHLAYVYLQPVAAGLKIRVKFTGTSYYRNGLVYFDKSVTLRRAQ